MEMIQGVEWLVLAVFAGGTILCVYLVASVQGDLRLTETSGVNTDEEAKSMFISLLCGTRKTIDIHDDGNDFPESVYNCPDVLDVLREQIQKKPKIRVRCLFNDADQELGLLKLARSEKYGKNIEIWYLKGDRPEPDVHYKIVDCGRFVHLSAHAHGLSEREYRLRDANCLWSFGTRRRISKQYRDNFVYGLRNAVRAA